MEATKTEEKPKINEIYTQIEEMEHEQLVICYDKPTGLWVEPECGIIPMKQMQ